MIVSRRCIIIKITSISTIMDKSSFVKQNKERYLDFRYAAQVSICLLKPMGAWPLDDQATKLEIILHRLSIIVIGGMQFMSLLPWFIYLFTGGLSFYDILRTACPLIYCSTIFLRYLLLLFHQSDIKSCLDRVAEDWQNVELEKDREIMLTHAKTGRLFGIISVTFMFTSGIPYLIMPYTSGPIVTENNVTIKLLPNPCDLVILDVQVSPVYEVVYIWEAVTCIVMYIIFCGICSLIATLVTYVCGQCDILICLFEDLVDGKQRKPSTVDERIGIATRHHLRIIKFVSDVDKMMNEICLAEFVNASCNICLLGYYVIMDWNNGEAKLQAFVYGFAFVSITFNIYILCYIGELLVAHCQKIGTACYMIEWYRLPYQKSRSLILPIIISSYPLEITAGKMLNFTMNSFSNILKSSMAYFNLLREVAVRDT